MHGVQMGSWELLWTGLNLFIFLAPPLVMGLVASLLAAKRERNRLGWFLLTFAAGLFFWLPSVIVLAVLALLPPGAAEKTCPRCVERIKAAAQVCRYCGHEFAPPSETP